MFTGIVEELGTVVSVTPVADGARVVIAATTVLGDAHLGDSIAVNGCCLTVVELGEGSWAADAVTETLDRTALGELAAGDRVNLERPVRVEDRLGGHIVQGHVDGVGRPPPFPGLDDGEAAAVDRDRVADLRVLEDGRGLEREPPAVAAADPTELLDDAGEHQIASRIGA